MTRQFTYPPSVYQEESHATSKFWSVWLPIMSVVVTVAVAWFDRPTFLRWFASETTGILEFIHFLFPLLTALIALRLLFFKQIKQDRILFLWCLAMFVGGIYLSGEEASWGQHYVGWTTSEYWSAINDQQETNIHNTLALFDQVPRLILSFGIVITGLIYPYLLLHRPNVLPRRWDFTFPPLATRTLTAIIVLSAVYSHFRSFFLREWEHVGFLRPGEFQETYIVWFLLYYALYIYWRAKSWSADLV